MQRGHAIMPPAMPCFSCRAGQQFMPVCIMLRHACHVAASACAWHDLKLYPTPNIGTGGHGLVGHDLLRPTLVVPAPV